MNYKIIGYKPRDDWILSKDVMIARARFRAVRTVPLHPKYYYKGEFKMANYKTFQMKMYGDEDEKLTRLAEIANTDKTTLVKHRTFSDEGIIIAYQQDIRQALRYLKGFRCYQQRTY